MVAALPRGVARILESWFLPNARIFGLTVAAAEFAIALLILHRGRATQLGLLAATGFHIVLALLFGMWPYTLPMIVGLGYLSTFDFTDGPVAHRGPRGAGHQGAAGTAAW